MHHPSENTHTKSTKDSKVQYGTFISENFSVRISKMNLGGVSFTFYACETKKMFRVFLKSLSSLINTARPFKQG